MVPIEPKSVGDASVSSLSKQSSRTQELEIATPNKGKNMLPVVTILLKIRGLQASEEVLTLLRTFQLSLSRRKLSICMPSTNISNAICSYSDWLPSSMLKVYKESVT